MPPLPATLTITLLKVPLPELPMATELDTTPRLK